VGHTRPNNQGDTLLVTKVDLARSTSDLYRIVSTFADKGVASKVFDDPAIEGETGKPAPCSRARPTSYGADDEELPRVPDSKARQKSLARQYSGHDALSADCKFPWQPMGWRLRSHAILPR
jgi:hypothetical protein